VYQKDIEREFHINRSTVTSVMQVMEKNGLIERKAVAGDSRLKQVCLTHTGETVCERTKEIFRATEQQLRTPLSEAELSEFLRIAQKIEQHIR
jgi:DNA-binding MarR family transcriptional regulator